MSKKHLITIQKYHLQKIPLIFSYHCFIKKSQISGMPARTIILAMILLAAGPAGRAQSWYFQHLQVENGLSNNAVICSLQDKRGFLWFGTKDGLDRFDGYSFKIF